MEWGMSQDNEVTFKIGLLGPTRVGKTSLVTALLAQSQILLAGSGIAMRTVGPATEDKIAQSQAELEGDLLARKFQSAGLTASVEPFTFKLRLDPGVATAEINLDLLDFPGGWLTASNRPAEYAADWERCRRFITQSTILLVPVDAALLMESAKAIHRQALPRLLNTHQVEQVARDWAIERNRKPHEPALIVFCPVKCESYFADNGGRNNRSVLLLERFHAVYDGVISAVRSEADKATLLYAPVDTIGCIETVEPSWIVDPDGKQDFRAEYRIRPGAKVSRVGADDVMRALCRQLIMARKVLDEEQSRSLDSAATQAQSYQDRNEGFFRNLVLWATRERVTRRESTLAKTREAEDAWRRVAALDTVLEKIAATPYGPRVHKL